MTATLVNGHPWNIITPDMVGFFFFVFLFSKPGCENLNSELLTEKMTVLSSDEVPCLFQQCRHIVHISASA